MFCDNRYVPIATLYDTVVPSRMWLFGTWSATGVTEKAKKLNLDIIYLDIIYYLILIYFNWIKLIN